MESVYLMSCMAVIFVAVFAASMLVLRAFADASAMRRLARSADRRTTPGWPRTGRFAALTKLSAPLMRLSMPDQDWEKSTLPKRFLHAGLRNVHAPKLYFTTKTVLAFASRRPWRYCYRPRRPPSAGVRGCCAS